MSARSVEEFMMRMRGGLLVAKMLRVMRRASSTMAVDCGSMSDAQILNKALLMKNWKRLIRYVRHSLC